MPLWKKFLVASLIAFSSTLFSCDITLKGEVNNTAVTTSEIACPIKNSPAINDTSGITAPLPNTVTVGDIEPVIVLDVSQGIVMIAPELSPPEVKIVAQVDTAVTSKSPVKNIQDSMGIIEFDEQDALKTKNLPKADSINCNTKEFY